MSTGPIWFQLRDGQASSKCDIAQDAGPERLPSHENNTRAGRMD